MSATTGLAKQADGLEKLLSLANLKASDIAAAGEETRRQMQLTEEEQAKVATARAYISTHYTLSSNLQHREEALAANRLAHEKAVTDFNAHVASENIRLEAFAAKLDERDKVHADVDKRHAEMAAKLISDKAEQDRQHQEAIASLQKEQSKNTGDAKSNETEKQRLQEWADTLKRKAEIARQQMSQF